MSAIQNIQVGDEVPILLQLVDGVSDQYPQAEVRDADGTLLTTYNLVHEASGLYVPSLPYNMPDEDFIKLTFIVYSDSGHGTENDMYERQLDVFYKILPNEFKADVSAIPINPLLVNDPRLDNLDTTISSRADQNPPSQVLNDYKADVSAIPTNPLLTNDVRLDNLNATISSRSSHTAADIWAVAVRTLTSFTTLITDIWANGTRTLTAGTKDSEIDAIKAETDKIQPDIISVPGNYMATGFATLNPPSQNLADYMAIGFSVPNEYDARLVTIQADLDDTNQYKADISGLAPSGEYDTEMGYIPNDLADVPTGAELNAAHGAGSWEGGGGTAPTVSEIDAELTANHGAGSWQEGDGMDETDLHNGLNSYVNKNDYKADISGLATESNAVINRNLIITQVDDNEVKIDTVIASITALNDIAIADVQIALTNQGYTLVRAVLLDNLNNLDHAISLLHDLSQADVQAAMTAQGYTSVRAVLIDNLDAAITDVLLALVGVQSDLDNPNQYKADVSLLALEATLLTIKVKTDNLKDIWNDPDAVTIADTVLDRVG